VTMLLQGVADRVGKLVRIHGNIMRQPRALLARNKTQKGKRSYCVRSTTQVMSSDWRVAPTNSSTLLIR
jgi:hypothetical protein